MIKKLEPQQQQMLMTLLALYPQVQTIVQRIAAQGGRALLVGGAVRDIMLGQETKDLDIEVHGLAMQQLEDLLAESGPVSLVGKSFGVLRLHSLDVDWSLPRSDSSGRKPEVIIDPHMSIENAFRRRDLTINAMGIDLVTFELLDPFDGLEDLQEKKLRAPDPIFFIEDPLRFFRVMQFIGRFGMEPDEHLNAICKQMDISTVSRERIEVEFEKLFLKSKQPSLGIRWLCEINRLSDVLPEVAALIGVPQDPKWHPEGDAFEHTMQTLDAAAAMQYESDKLKLYMLYAALCHDLGKADTTVHIDGQWKSYEHPQEGELLAKQLLRRITNNSELIACVSALVKYHMMPVQFIQGGASSAAYKRLARKLAPYATLQMLADLALADKRGRNPRDITPFTIYVPEIEQFLAKAENLQVRQHIEEPVLQGRDLLDVIEPGPKLGELVKAAYEIQLEESIQDKEELKRRVLAIKK